MVEQPRRVKLQKYEALLNRFRFADALDAVLEVRGNETEERGSD